MSKSQSESVEFESEESSGKDGLKFTALVVLLVIIGIVAAYQFVGPPPPSELVMATGVEGGAYRTFGRTYSDVLKRSEIEVALHTTAGSIENFEAIRTGRADVALVQGGTGPEDVGEFAKGIASVYYEPLWIFHRSDLEVVQLSDLRGMRIQVGVEGSGTRAVAIDLLELNGIDNSNATLLEDTASVAVDSLLENEADVIMLIMGPRSEQIARLMDVEGKSVRLFDVDRHLAYERTNPYLAHVILAEGVLDFERNVPDRNIDLLAPTAVLLAHVDLHPALVPLFIQAAEETHGGGDLLAAPKAFPSPDNLDAPLAAASDEYFRKGPSFLYRIFPFGLAATLDRLKIMLLPLLTLLIPLFRVAPPLYRWRIRRKIFRWYGNLERIERKFESDHTTHDACLNRLASVENDVIESVDVPTSYKEELHNLLQHVERVRMRIERLKS